MSPSQQQKYDHRYEKLSSETEEIPDLASYLGEGGKRFCVRRSRSTWRYKINRADRAAGDGERQYFDVIDTDAVTLEAAEEPDAEVENQEEAGVETAEVIEVSEDESKFSRQR